MSKWDQMQPRERDAWLCERIGDVITGQDCPHYTTDITAAMGLAEAMRKQGYFVKIILRQEGHKARHKYYCEVEERMGERPNDATDVYIGNTDTLPDSIAYACFLALGGEE